MAFGAIDGSSNLPGAIIIMESEASEKAFERYKQIVNLLKSIKNKKGLALVQELIEKCANYIKITNEMGVFIKVHQSREQDVEKYREQYRNIDQRKRLTHEALISQLNIVNRYLFRNKEELGEIPPGGIFSRDPITITNRNAVGDWAKDLIDALHIRGIVNTKMM